MKLSKTSWAILAFGIMVITFGSLGVTRSQRLSEVKQLSENLTVAQLRLSRLDLKDLTSQQEKLEGQMEQAKSLVDADVSALFLPNDSITISDAMFQIAGASGVEVTRLNTSAIATGKLDKLGTSTLPVDAVVRGDVPNLIDFVARLNTDFPTGIVKLGEIVIPRTDNITDNVTADTRPSAHVQLVIYSYQRAKP